MRLSEHFTLQEFDCHSGAVVPPELVPNVQRLVDEVLEPLRAKWCGPLVVISGYRAPLYNLRIGGAPKSAHMEAMAADVRPLHVEVVPQLAADVEEMIQGGLLPSLGGFGKYRGSIHLDVRKPMDGHLRRWLGSGMGSEPGG